MLNRPLKISPATNTTMKVNRFGQSVCGLETVVLHGQNSTTANRRLAKVAVQCSADTFVVN